MPAYKKLYEWKDLPEGTPASAVETLELDYKAQHKKDAGEHAKDMAAFANAHGGVLLVGVSETADSFSRCLLPVAVAKQVAKDYEDAARDLLAPRPLVDPVVIPFPGDVERALAAINVDPFPGQIIGARLPQSDAWRFPIRTAARHTTYVDPEKAMIYADPKSRKAAILLGAVTEGTRLVVQVPLLSIVGQLVELRDEMLEGEFGRVDASTNIVEVWVRLPGGNQRFPVFAPLEDVEAVWLAFAAWNVRFSGCIRSRQEAMNTPCSTIYISGPSRNF